VYDVVAATQHRHLRGALDLDFLATSAETMLAVGQAEACRMVLARAQKVMARRADAIDEPTRRERFLASTFAQRLQGVAGKLVQ
jgi:hypothetical protein